MTNRQAISAEIEPYGLPDDSIEKAYIDACSYLGTCGDIEGTYRGGEESNRIVCLAAMYCLNQLISLSSENVGGVAQSYDTNKLEKRIKALAKKAGISADVVLSDGTDSQITYISI